MNNNELEQFKELVCEWVKLDDIVRVKNAELKEIKSDKKSIEEYILECMNKLDEGVIDISDGKLRLNKTKTKSGLKQTIIQEALTELIKDNTQAQTMTQYILDKRPVVERMNLKRTFNRKDKK
jgi:hypothetical protein